MKQLSLYIAIGAVALGSQAYATPKITGTLKAFIQEDTKHTVEKNATTTLQDEKTGRAELYGTSRLKFSGSEKLNDVLTASYSLEYDFHLDNERENTFRSRSTYASIDHKEYGRIRAGRMTSPEDDLDIGVTVGENWGVALPFTGFGGRSNNALQYYSPYFGEEKKTRVKLHYGMDENNDTERSINTYVDGKRVSKKRDNAVAQILHNGKTFGWGLSYTQAGDDFNAISAMARYQVTPELNAALLVRQADYKSGNKETGAFASSSYNLENNWRVYGQAGYTENFSGVKDASVTIGAIGISKDIKTSGGRATIFGELAGERYERTRTNSSGVTTNLTEDTYGFGTGLVYKF